MPNMSQVRYQEQFPVLPEPAASTRCHHCVWCWMNGRMTIKFINRCCASHARFPAVP